MFAPEKAPTRVEDQLANSAVARANLRDTEFMKSRLHEDLYLDHRDAMYRALSFIERRGGPALTGDTREILVNSRDRAREWLEAQSDSAGLSKAYEQFVETWSPVFHDW